MIKRVMFLMMVVFVCVVGRTLANPDMNATQPVAGSADNRWSFMTAWNLSTGRLDVSSNWYAGRLVWSHPAPKTQWIARFVYDQPAGRTAELAWYYCQWFVQ